jgi:hypothetical protein
MMTKPFNRFSPLQQAQKAMTAKLRAELASMGKSEYQHHCQVVELLRNAGVPGLMFWHTPNGGKMTPQRGARMRAMGVMAGVSDLIIALPNGKMCFLELKSKKGVLSGAQEAFLEAMDKTGHLWSISYDFADSEGILREWGAIR